ncbi:hypothetical protein KFU94_61620 [Chloroflexi bacterium TSY]|nr:hypothetical protein [Chloroflexi bacterium TSY]
MYTLCLILMQLLIPEMGLFDWNRNPVEVAGSSQIETHFAKDSFACEHRCEVWQPAGTQLYLTLQTIEAKRLNGLSLVTIPSGSYIKAIGTLTSRGRTWLKIDTVWTYLPQIQELNDHYVHWERQKLDLSAQNQFVPLDSAISSRLLPIALRAPQSAKNHETASQIIDLGIMPDKQNTAGYGLMLKTVRQIPEEVQNTRQIEVTLHFKDGRKRVRYCSMYLPAHSITERVTISHCFGVNDFWTEEALSIRQLIVRDGTRLLEAELAVDSINGEDLTTIKILSVDRLPQEHRESVSQIPEAMTFQQDVLLFAGFPGFLQPPMPSHTRIRVFFTGKIDSAVHNWANGIGTILVELDGIILPKLKGMSNSTVFIQRSRSLEPIGLVSAGYTYLKRPQIPDVKSSSVMNPAPTKILVLLPPKIDELAIHHAHSRKIQTETFFLNDFDQLVQEVVAGRAEIDRFLFENCEPDEYKELTWKLNTIYAVGPRQQLLKAGKFNQRLIFIIGDHQRQIAYSFVVEPPYADQPASYEFIRVYGIQNLPPARTQTLNLS